MTVTIMSKYLDEKTTRIRILLKVVIYCTEFYNTTSTRRPLKYTREPQVAIYWKLLSLFAKANTTSYETCWNMLKNEQQGKRREK